MENNVWITKYKAITDGLFRKIFAIIIVIGSGNFLFEMAEKDPGDAKLIVGFVFGVITTIIAFYFGTSQSSQDKEKKKGDNDETKE